MLTLPRHPSHILMLYPMSIRGALCARLSGLGCFCCKFLGKAESVHGVFQRPFAEFVSGQVISLIVGNSSCLMSMNCKVVQL